MNLEPASEQFLGKGAAMETGTGAHPSPLTELCSCPNKQLLSLLKAQRCQEIQVLNNVQNPSAGNIPLLHSLALDAFQARCIPCLPEELRATGSDPSHDASFQPKHRMSPCHLSIPKDLQRFAGCRSLALEPHPSAGAEWMRWHRHRGTKAQLHGPQPPQHG